MRWSQWLILGMLASIGCGGFGGVQLPGQKYKVGKLKPEQTFEVNNDTEAWALECETGQGGPYRIVVTADQPVDVAYAPNLPASTTFNAIRDPKDMNLTAMMTFMGQKEYVIEGTISPNLRGTLLVHRGKGSGPTKVTVKREK
jgi:hypothetical protein